jgi:hypothetical protein
MQKCFWRRSARTVALLAALTPAMAQVRYPDLRVIVPTDRFSIAQTQTGREFRYTRYIQRRSRATCDSAVL